MKAIFTDEKAARKHLEALRWPNGPVCPHEGCGGGKIGKVENRKKTYREGLYYCSACDRTFTVTVGTVFERSKIPLHKWVYAFYMYSSSKKGFSAHQLHRTLDITYKSAWFMAHRVREAMRPSNESPMGGEGSIIEADETYFGDNEVVTKRTKRGKASLGSKRMVLSLVERGGEVRSFHVDRREPNEVARIVAKNISKEAKLFTDESRLYDVVGKEFAAHETVRHKSYEYARGDVHTNTIEGYFGIFKRGMSGVYQHCGERHLHRYLAEFDFRYSNRKITDGERADIALKNAEGKRLMYQETHREEVTA